MSTPLARLFPDEDYRFHLRMERGEPAEFFAPTPPHGLLVTERQRWLRSDPDAYAALLPPGEALLEETSELAQSWNGFVPHGLSPRSTLLALGEFWEPDYLLLKAESDGEIRLYGGCLCFPSSWRLADKIGKPIEFIHEPVPTLNSSIGPAIHKFLAGLKPGSASLRHNWGLARSPELNHHPDRDLPRLDAGVGVDEVWLRVEHQALVALPRSGGILFGIRVVNHPLADVNADRLARVRLRRALESMPDAIAVYKGLGASRASLLHAMRDPPKQ
jgi:dimethylamine monooxygenase subunit A